MNEPKITDPNQVGGQQVAEGTQPVPVPSTDETKPVETSGDVSTDTLPEGVSERTAEQFDKLTAKNQELQAALKQKEDEAVASSIFDVFNSGAETPVESKRAPVPAAPVARSTGNTAAEEALRIAQQTRQEVIRADQARQEREAYAAHPWLNPKSSEYNQEARDIVEGQVITAYAKGQPIDLVNIASRVSGFVKGTDVDTAKTQAVSEYKEAQGKKVVTAPVGNKAPPGGYDEASVQDLKTRSLDDPSARAERIRRALK